jgi:zinc protease
VSAPRLNRPNRLTVFASLLLVAALIVPSLASGAAPPSRPSGAERLPAPEKIVLQNGLTVYYLRNTTTPLVSLWMCVGGAGSASEPAEREGIAGLCAALLTKGAADRDADAVAEALDFMGATLDVSAAEEYAQVRGESLSEHFPRLLEIATDCLVRPSFKEDEFAKERANRIDRVKAAKDNPGLAIRYYFQRAYFGSHPLGRLAGGTEASLGAMTVQAVKDFYAARYRPDAAIAAVVGDIERGKLGDLLETTLGRWVRPSGQAPAISTPPLPKPKGVKLVLVDKPDASQAYFALGAPGYAMGDPINARASVMNTLWGGRFTSWLNSELRIKRGLTYGARSNLLNWRTGGVFTVMSYTKNDKIGEMLDITFDLLKKGVRQGFGVEEVESGRNYMLGQFPPTLETNARKAASYVQLAFYGLGFDYYDKYLAEIAKVTPDGAKAAAVKLLPQSDYVLVVLGKAADIKAQLAKFGTWQEKRISDPGF